MSTPTPVLAAHLGDLLTVNVYIIVIYDVITVDYCKYILLYSPLNSCTLDIALEINIIIIINTIQQ